MNIKTLITPLTALAIFAALPSCGRIDAQTSAPSEGTTAEVETAEAIVALDPDPKAVLARCSERWNFVTNADWMQAYDFFSDARKRTEKLAGFLGGKEYHEYQNASKPALIGLEDGLGFVEISVDWTPHHPELQAASNIPAEPDAMRQTIDMIETWEWVDNLWYYQGAARRTDFFKEHPQLAK